MKIAIIASIWISVPPQDFGFGAQEYLAYYIAEGMKRKGHDVTLFATADSKTSGTLVSVAEKQVIDIGFPDPKVKDIFELINVSEAYKRADEFDIIHNHLLPYGLLLADWSKTPTVHTRRGCSFGHWLTCPNVHLLPMATSSILQRTCASHTSGRTETSPVTCP
jgi:hypothetical protein